MDYTNLQNLVITVEKDHDKSYYMLATTPAQNPDVVLRDLLEFDFRQLKAVNSLTVCSVITADTKSYLPGLDGSFESMKVAEKTVAWFKERAVISRSVS